MGGLPFAEAGPLWGFVPANLLGRGPIVPCDILDEGFVNFCATVGGNEPPPECERLSAFAGARCGGTEAIGVSLLGLYCLIQAGVLGVFMRMDAGFEHPDEEMYGENFCTCLPPWMFQRRFSMLLLPVVLMPFIGGILMLFSLNMGGCLFGCVLFRVDCLTLLSLNSVQIWSVHDADSVHHLGFAVSTSRIGVRTTSSGILRKVGNHE